MGDDVIITIETWLDSGANHDSAYLNSFEIDSDIWESMSNEEKDEYAKDYAWENMDWGWKTKEQQ